MFHIGFLSKASNLSAASVKLRKSLSWTPLRLFGVEFEEQGDAVGVCCRRLQSICLVDKRVEVRVGFHEIGRHRKQMQDRHRPALEAAGHDLVAQGRKGASPASHPLQVRPTRGVLKPSRQVSSTGSSPRHDFARHLIDSA